MHPNDGSADLPAEETLLQELGQAVKAARVQAGLAQRELGHKIGYSRTSIANAETGACRLSREFYERVDAVLNTKLAHAHAVIRVLRAERLNAKITADSAGSADEFQERCEEIVQTVALRVPDHVEIQADVGGAWRKAIQLPEQTLRIVIEIHVLEKPE
jgi:transcriptional regulator with XRE-family HTH domain